MTWPAVVLAAVNMAQVVLLAWLAGRQQQVKRELGRVNGEVGERLEAIERSIEHTFESSGRPL